MNQQAISYDARNQDFLNAGRPLKNLSPREQSVLRFFLHHPYEKHTKDAIIEQAWPDEAQLIGITDDSLYGVIASLRRKIEPSGLKQAHIVTWRGSGESGYRFFPVIKLPSGEP